MYFIRAAPAVAWNSQAGSSLLTRFLFRRYFWLGRAPACTQPCTHMALRGLCEGLSSGCLDLQAACWQEISLYQDVPLEDHFQAVVRMTSTCGGQVEAGGWGPRQPLGWKLVLAVPPWDWRVNHGLFLWLLFASKLRAALMNVACVNLEALLGNHGKMENRILVCVTPGMNSSGSTRALGAHRASGAASSSWGRDLSLCLPGIFIGCPVQPKANAL